MTIKECQAMLRNLGWDVAVDGVLGPITRQAVRDFQRGWNFSVLAVDGVPGPLTSSALHLSVARGGRCSPNFTYRAFKSKGDGWIRVHRRLVAGLEKYRTRVGGDFDFSGYRDPAYNAKVGGAAGSTHLWGLAADLHAPSLTVEQVRALTAFSGIGYRGSDGLVSHVDVRHVEPVHNYTGGRVASPTTWVYSA